jgi:hypothetical protein
MEQMTPQAGSCSMAPALTSKHYGHNHLRWVPKKIRVRIIYCEQIMIQ